MTQDAIATGLAKLGLFLRSQAWRQAEATGLTPTQAQILVHLVKRGPARVSTLAAEIAVTQPTVSDAVAALIRKGHVEKRPDPDDRRAAKLHPGKAAATLVAAIEAWPDALLTATDVLDPAERAALLKGLTKMIHRLQVQGAIPVQRMCVTCRHFRPYQHQDAAMPHHCRCGHLDDPGLACAKAPRCAEDYQKRISGPLFDRIDLHVEVAALSAQDLTLPVPCEGSAEVAARVAAARRLPIVVLCPEAMLFVYMKRLPKANTRRFQPASLFL